MRQVISNVMANMRALKVFGLVTLLVTSFFAGAFTAGARHWFQPVAHVSIRNASGHDFSALKLTYMSGGITSNVVLPALKYGQTTDVRFYVAGEGGYEIEARFGDGRVLKGGAGYVESGYSVAEVVGTSKIEGRTVSHGY
jgi:hypothetical protein